MKALICAAGTKYLAISIVRAGAPIFNGCEVMEILRLMIPSRHRSRGVEHARAGISGGGDIGDRGVEPASQIGRNRLARQNPRGRRPLRNSDDDPLAGIGRMLAERRAAHLQTDWQFRSVDRQKRQIHAVETAFLDERGGQVLPGDDDMRLRLRERLRPRAPPSE